MIRVAIIGASGYTGGELLRLLLHHPAVEITQATSESNLGKFIYQIHPHLRGRTQLRFTSQATIEPCDVLFLALPHGEAQKRISQFSAAGRQDLADKETAEVKVLEAYLPQRLSQEEMAHILAFLYQAGTTAIAPKKTP